MGIGIQLHPVGREGSIITENEALKNLKQILENYINTTPPKYYPPVENLLDLIYETYTESNPVAPKTIGMELPVRQSIYQTHHLSYTIYIL